jgi:hypothetical protein
MTVKEISTTPSVCEMIMYAQRAHVFHSPRALMAGAFSNGISLVSREQRSSRANEIKRVAGLALSRFHRGDGRLHTNTGISKASRPLSERHPSDRRTEKSGKDATGFWCWSSMYTLGGTGRYSTPYSRADNTTLPQLIARLTQETT